MADWSDRHAREDPTIVGPGRDPQATGERDPDRDYLKFADNPWVSCYGEVNPAPTGR